MYVGSVAASFCILPEVGTIEVGVPISRWDSDVDTRPRHRPRAHTKIISANPRSREIVYGEGGINPALDVRVAYEDEVEAEPSIAFQRVRFDQISAQERWRFLLMHNFRVWRQAHQEGLFQTNDGSSGGNDVLTTNHFEEVGDPLDRVETVNWHTLYDEQIDSTGQGHFLALSTVLYALVFFNEQGTREDLERLSRRFLCRLFPDLGMTEIPPTLLPNNSATAAFQNILEGRGRDLSDALDPCAPYWFINDWVWADAIAPEGIDVVSVGDMASISYTSIDISSGSNLLTIEASSEEHGGANDFLRVRQNDLELMMHLLGEEVWTGSYKLIFSAESFLELMWRVNPTIAGQKRRIDDNVLLAAAYYFCREQYGDEIYDSSEYVTKDPKDLKNDVDGRYYREVTGYAVSGGKNPRYDDLVTVSYVAPSGQKKAVIEVKLYPQLGSRELMPLRGDVLALGQKLMEGAIL